MERAVGKNVKLESFKLESLKIIIFAEVGKSQAKLERIDWSWKIRAGVGKIGLNYDELSNFSHNFSSSFKLSNFSQVFSTAAKLSNLSKPFQLQKKLSNFGQFYPTSIGSF